ncbi:MAG: nicotinate-nucleotide adenylyltransferase [Acidobacteria bacterium]|nr:nicotinate-nucleotide adenylyltransferase [Acidobacteriota bacterium]MCL5289192.1 nicotinate-nucleotide adenylyltransferase [Acidobacteriota bacterium]
MSKPPSRPRRIALYGGSFDPIHAGHLAVARAAQRRFHLDEIHFVVAGRPPHKLKQDAAPFPHRFAMVALACAGYAHFVPSLAEAGDDFSGRSVHFSVDTVRRFRRLAHRADRLYFLLGVDSFLELPTWRSYEALLGACDFIVVSRPGFRMELLRRGIPPRLLQPGAPHTSRVIHLRKTDVHLLDSVASHVSSSQVRQRRRRRQSIHGLVPAAVEEYILTQGLYL